MSWKSGGRLFEGIAELISEHVADAGVKYSLFDGIVTLFEDYDCDGLEQTRGIDESLDEVLSDRYGSIDEDMIDDEE